MIPNTASTQHLTTQAFIFVLLALTLSACTSLTHTQAPIQGVAPNHPLVAITGRTLSLRDGAVQFAYPGVTLAVNVKAKAASFKASSTSGNNYVDVYVDGKLEHTIKLAKATTEYPLFQSNRPSTKTIQIVNRSESWHGHAIVQSLHVDQGKFLAPPEKPTTKLLVIGDSVTCGEAVNRQPNCAKDPSWWDAYNSYGMQLGRALNAETHLVCYGGRGLTRSWDGDASAPQAPEYYNMALPEPYFAEQHDILWTHEGFTADIILVSLGTNDFSSGIPDKEMFVQKYVEFAETLLTDHPRAFIAITDGAILNDTGEQKKSVLQDYLTTTQTRIDNERLMFIPSKHYPGDECDAHPTGEQHTKMARDLEAQLRQLRALPQ